MDSTSLASMIRTYEQLQGGALLELREFHKYLKDPDRYRSTLQGGSHIEGGAPPPLLGLGNALGPLDGADMDASPEPSGFEYDKYNRIVDSRIYSTNAFKRRIGDVLVSKELSPLGNLIRCGDYGCTYSIAADANYIYKIVPARFVPDDESPELFQGLLYGDDEYVQEAVRMTVLSNLNLGPKVMWTGAIQVPLTHIDRIPFRERLNASTEQKLGEGYDDVKLDNLPVYVFLMERLANVESAKGVDDTHAFYDRKLEIVRQAEHALKCRIDVGDLEWGYSGSVSSENLRVFDVDCLNVHDNDDESMSDDTSL